MAEGLPDAKQGDPQRRRSTELRSPSTSTQRGSDELLSPGSYSHVFEKWREGTGAVWRRGSDVGSPPGSDLREQREQRLTASNSPSSGSGGTGSGGTGSGGDATPGRRKQRGRWVRSSSVRMSIAPSVGQVESEGQSSDRSRRKSTFFTRQSAGLLHRKLDQERLSSVPPEVLRLCEDSSVRTEAFRYLLSISNERRSLSPWRTKLVRFIETKLFNRIVLGLIFLNCVFLAMEDPTDGDNSSVVNKVVVFSEYVFTGAFTIEMGLKITALGLWGNSFSYLRDPWNVLDGVIVVSAVITIIVDLSIGGTDNGAAISGLRALRLLRPLKAVSKVEQVSIIITSLFQSLPQLVDVMLLYFLFLLIFGIMSIQLWKGQLNTRCFSDTGGVDLLDRICTSDLSKEYSYKCPWGYSCLHHQNPNHGKTSFDNIGAAILTLFTALTLEGWTDLMYDVIDATTPFAALYFVFVLLVGTFFIVNLTLAIINTAFESNVKVLKENQASLNKDTTLLSRMASRVDGGELDLPPEEPNIEQRFRQRVKQFIQTDGFAGLMMVLIFINTLIMATEHHGQPVEMSDLQDYSFWVFTMIFLCETVIKLYALSLREFISDNINILDAVIVVVGVLNPLIDDDVRVFVVLRSFRLMRAFRLLTQFPDLWLFVQTLENSIVGASVLTLLLALVLFIYSLLGMQFFGGEFCGLEGGEDNSTCPGRPREHFDTLGWSLLTVFMIVTGEDWNKVMYNGMRAGSDLAAFYFVSLVVIGNYLVLNLFIAVLFSGLAAAEQGMDFSEQEIEPDSPTTSKLRRFQSICCCGGNQTTEPGVVQEQSVPDAVEKAEQAFKCCGLNRATVVRRNRSSVAQDVELLVAEGIIDNEGEGLRMYEVMLEAAKEKNSPGEQGVTLLMPPEAAFVQREETREKLTTHESFVFIPGDHVTRVWLRRVVGSPVFEGVVLFVVLLSSVALTLEDPLAAPDEALPRALEQIDFLIAMLFTFEAVLKVYAYGFIMGKSTYLRRDPWNRLDFFIVCCALLSFIFRRANLSGSAVGAIEVVRMMRTLRPLRAVAKSSGMRLVLQSLLSSLPSLSHVLVISILILTIFGIMGIQFFSGRFYACTDVHWGDNAAISNETACYAAGYNWVSHKSNFDNLGMAIITLFQIATLEGWIEVMYLGIDSTQPGEGLVVNYRPWMACYFLVFVVVGAFFLVNLFTGVLVDKYERQHRASAAAKLTTNPLTLTQIEWKQILEVMTTTITPLNRHSNAGKVTLFITSVVLRDEFDNIIMGCIGLNTIVMSMEHAGQGSEWDLGLFVANVLFVGVFTAEAVMKVIAFTPRGYVTDHWNKFDFTVLIISILGIIMNLTYTAGPALSIFRILRLARLLRAVRVARGLRTLIRTLILSLRGLLNVAGLLAIFFFLYAVVGVKLFGKVQKGEYITEQANFDKFENAVLLLFRMTTGEAWQGIMHDCQVEEPACDPQLDTCGHPSWAGVYFISFMLGGAFVISNLIIAVILEDFLTAQEEEASLLTASEVGEFMAVWARYDPIGTGFLTTPRLEGFLLQVGLPLGLKMEWSRGQKNEKLQRIAWDLYEVDGRVHVRDVLIGCAQVLVDGAVGLPRVDEELYEKRWKDIFRESLAEAEVERGDRSMSVRRVLAAMRIQSLWRGKSVRTIRRPPSTIPSPPSTLPSPPDSRSTVSIRSPISLRSSVKTSHLVEMRDVHERDHPVVPIDMQL